MEGSFLLKNENGIEVVVLRRGAIIQSLRVPGRDGSMADVVLGFDDEQPYKVGPHWRFGRSGGECCCCCAAARPIVLHPPTALLQDGTSPYMGAVVGRVANRIAGGRFSLDGKEYRLARNNGPNCLHGAPPPTAGCCHLPTDLAQARDAAEAPHLLLAWRCALLPRALPQRSRQGHHTSLPSRGSLCVSGCLSLPLQAAMWGTTRWSGRRLRWQTRGARRFS